jgi:hypothetical protein
MATTIVMPPDDETPEPDDVVKAQQCVDDATDKLNEARRLAEKKKADAQKEMSLRLHAEADKAEREQEGKAIATAVLEIIDQRDARRFADMQAEAEAARLAEAAAALPPSPPPRPVTTSKFTLILTIVVGMLTVAGETVLTYMSLSGYGWPFLAIGIVSLMVGLAVPYVLYKFTKLACWLGKALTVCGALAGLISIGAFVTLRHLNTLVDGLLRTQSDVPLSLSNNVGLASTVGFAALAVVAAIASEQCIEWFTEKRAAVDEPTTEAPTTEAPTTMGGDIEE